MQPKPEHDVDIGIPEAFIGRPTSTVQTRTDALHAASRALAGSVPTEMMSALEMYERHVLSLAKVFDQYIVAGETP